MLYLLQKDVKLPQTMTVSHESRLIVDIDCQTLFAVSSILFQD